MPPLSPIPTGSHRGLPVPQHDVKLCVHELQLGPDADDVSMARLACERPQSRLDLTSARRVGR